MRATVEDDLAVITLDRPRVHNALDSSTLAQLSGAVRELAPRAGALLIRAEGPHFCVGADLAEVRGRLGDPEAIRTFLTGFHETFGVIEAAEIPVVVAAQGYTLAGGLELALTSDVLLLASDAQLGDQHINLGLVPGGGGSQRLPLAIGMRRALALCLTGERLDAHEAVAAGLAHRRFPAATFRAAAEDYARDLSRRNRAATVRIKSLVRAAGASTMPERLDRELEEATRQLLEPATAAAIAEFLDRRA